MTEKFSARAILDALWARCGHVESAADLIGMSRSSYYERLARLGIDGGILRTLRTTGRFALPGQPDYEPSSGVERTVQPILLVRMQSGDDAPNLGSNVSTAAAVRELPSSLRWVPKPQRRTVVAFQRAVLDLADVGKLVTADDLLNLLAESSEFKQFVGGLVSLYRTKALMEEDKGR